MRNDRCVEQDSLSLEVLLRGQDVARILNVSRAFAYQLMQRGEIATVRIGNSVRVRQSDLETFIARNLHSAHPAHSISESISLSQ